MTWGEIRQVIQADIAPGGPKARDRNPFVCFRDKGFCGEMYADSTVALPEHLERFCYYTPQLQERLVGLKTTAGKGKARQLTGHWPEVSAATF